MLTSVVGPVLSHRGRAEVGVPQPGLNPWWSQGLLPVRNTVRTRHSFAWMCDLLAILQKRGRVTFELFRNLDHKGIGAEGSGFCTSWGVFRLAEHRRCGSPSFLSASSLCCCPSLGTSRRWGVNAAERQDSSAEEACLLLCVIMAITCVINFQNWRLKRI